MRVTKVVLFASDTNYIEMSFRDPTNANHFVAKAILGLDADELVPKYYGTGPYGDKFFELGLRQREVILRMALNPHFHHNHTYSDLRDELYRLISVNRSGSLSVVLVDGEDIVASVQGFVTKLEAPQFSESPEAQLTLSCDDPMFRAVTPTVVDLTGLNPVDTIINDTKSTAPHGLKFELKVTAPFSTLVLDDLNSTDGFVVTPVGGFNTNDVIFYSSEFNDRYLYVKQGNLEKHLADVIQIGSIWPTLFPGENHIQTAEPVTWQSITYKPAYWGV